MKHQKASLFARSQRVNNSSSAEFAYRIFNTGSDRMLAVCDKSVIGRTLEENDMSFHVSEEFYSGKECGENEIKSLLKSSTIVNAVGNSIINLMLKSKMIDEKNILWISGVPHAQIIAVK